MPARIAYLLAPHLPLQAQLRADPELGGTALVIVDGQGPRDTVVDVSAEAARLGLAPGMTAAQARAAAPEAIYRQLSPELVCSASRALADLGASFSPWVESSAGEAALDVSDLGRLFPGPDRDLAIAQALQAGARKLGLAVHVGVASGKITARVAARAAAERGDALAVVAAGREAAFLEPLPVELLGPSLETLGVLERWGVRRIGELASLPKDGLALRLGKAGAQLGRIARAEEEAPLVPEPETPEFAEGIDFEWPLDNLEPLQFVLKRLLENLVARLSCRSLAAGDLLVSLRLDPRGLEERRVAVAAPTRHIPTLLELVRFELGKSPPQQPVIGLTIRASPRHARPAQLGFFEPAGPSPDKLAQTLARLTALFGEERVGSPLVPDGHRPDRFAVQRFDAGAGAGARPKTAFKNPLASNLRALTLHAFRPPEQAEALYDRGVLRCLRASRLGGQVIQLAGPFRIRDRWWTPAASLHDYYDVELSDGGLYRVYHDRLANRWLVDGCYE